MKTCFDSSRTWLPWLYQEGLQHITLNRHFREDILLMTYSIFSDTFELILGPDRYGREAAGFVLMGSEGRRVLLQGDTAGEKGKNVILQTVCTVCTDYKKKCSPSFHDNNTFYTEKWPKLPIFVSMKSRYKDLFYFTLFIFFTEGILGYLRL